ncbi:MAG: hypothetical protein QMC93_03660 [Patescibacteria group bacterium]|nr:hypothetical protein [Patescibacteria group bacterium]
MKKIIILLLLLLLLASPVQGQWRTLNWQADKWNSQNGLVIKYDKLEHGLLFGGITLLSEKNGWKWALILGTLNEIKDALFPYEKYGKYGGEGWSHKDMLANIIGISSTYYGRKLLKRIF